MAPHAALQNMYAAAHIGKQIIRSGRKNSYFSETVQPLVGLRFASRLPIRKSVGSACGADPAPKDPPSIEMVTTALQTAPLPDPVRLIAGGDPALFLDIDGTLIELADTPDGVVIAPGLPDVLIKLHDRLGGAVALITGRRLDDIDRLFGPLPLAAAGQHGLEQRDANGVVARQKVDSALMAMIGDKLRSFANRHPGTQVEDKGLTIALHYRNAPTFEQAARQFVEDALHGMGRALSMHDGKMVLEVKPFGTDKGTAVRGMMAKSPFAGRSPIFIGDDVTDEDGFRAANELGGTSIVVGHREPTIAHYRVADVDRTLELLTWLATSDRAAEVLGLSV